MIKASTEKKLKKWEKRALQLMRYYDLDLDGWSFEWINKKRVLGQCNKMHKEISLSKFYVEHCTDDTLIEDTIRHEIAHAIAPPGAGHNAVWKKFAVIVGAKPQRCKNVDLGQRIEYRATCPNNHKLPSLKRYRKPSRSACPICINEFKRNNDDKLNLHQLYHRFEIKWEKIKKENYDK